MSHSPESQKNLSAKIAPFMTRIDVTRRSISPASLSMTAFPWKLRLSRRWNYSLIEALNIILGQFPHDGEDYYKLQIDRLGKIKNPELTILDD